MLFVMLPIPVPAQVLHRNGDCITPFKNGRINWTTGRVTAVGKASPQDNNQAAHGSVPGSARADASRKIIEILKQVKIRDHLTVGQYASHNDVILAGIEKTARDAAVICQYYTSALDVIITIETPILGGFLQLVLPEDIRQIPGINAQKTINDPSRTSGHTGHIPYTGLIIDAQGLDLEPVLYPTIVSEQGKEVYSALFISREFAVQYGVCTYVCRMDQAKTHRRIGRNPLIFKALRKAPNDKACIVISMADFKRLEKATERHDFLKACRVIIVMGQ